MFLIITFTFYIEISQIFFFKFDYHNINKHSKNNKSFASSQICEDAKLRAWRCDIVIAGDSQHHVSDVPETHSPGAFL